MSTLDPHTTRRLAGALAAAAVLAGGTATAAQAAPAHRPHDTSTVRAGQWGAAQRTGATLVRRSTTAYRATSTTAYRTSAYRTSAHRATTTSTGTASTSSAASSSTGTNTGGSVTFASTTSISTAGLSANAVKVLKAVNAAFPQVTSIGGVRSGSDAQDHATGHALDLMIPNYDTAQGKALGNQIAAFLKAHQAELGVHYVIWSQHIWNVQRDAEGWRAMADRGSTTANHYDHVHVSVY